MPGPCAGTPRTPLSPAREIRLASYRVSSHCVFMSKPGRRSSSTPEQREQVLRLVAQGVSRRAVAREVFGDERLRGRVDRIIRESEPRGGRFEIEYMLERLAASQPDSSSVGEERPTLEDLAARYARQLRRRLDDSKDWVSAGELLAFGRLELFLENERLVEEANRLTREPDC
jgi:hypothetical protein